MTAWLGVVSAEHVRRGVSLGIAQIGHGKRAGLARMNPGDTLIYYSAREGFRDGPVLKQFTAIGTVADEEIWQADEGDFKPFRRRVTYDTSARPVGVDTLAGRLDLSAQPNWGYQLRRGLLQLTDRDAQVIREAMTGH
jgi:EVE domain